MLLVLKWLRAERTVGLACVFEDLRGKEGIIFLLKRDTVGFESQKSAL